MDDVTNMMTYIENYSDAGLLPCKENKGWYKVRKQKRKKGGKIKSAILGYRHIICFYAKRKSCLQ